jgi:lysyl-tRNA synthetase class 2
MGLNSLPKWQPSAAISILKIRANIIATIRKFFIERNVLEVETPLLCHATVTDPHIHSISAQYEHETVYLQTSPEYAMKRLLAAGSGAIFQICKAFRLGDLGVNHNPEFTMLEWYRPGFDHHALMDEMDLLLQTILKTPAAERVTYSELFQQYLAIDPHTADIHTLKNCAEKNNIQFVGELTECNDWLHLLLTHCIEPHMGKEKPLFLYDFPVSQAALAKIRHDEIPPVASRFEVYFKGIELANGFHELQNAKEQRKRFENDLKMRNSKIPIDEFFLAALENGLPDCAGVALGVDRLVMLATQSEMLKEVISFDFERV